MSRTPSFSVVTACLNARKTIAKLADSIAGNDYPHLEWIVIDGGSTDGTIGSLSPYREHISFLHSGPDQGISDAFNKGIARASGEVIGIVSADDFLVPGALEALARSLTVSHEADVYYGDAIAVAGGTALWNGVPTEPGDLRRGFPLKHASVWIARRAYERYGGYSLRYRLAMDYELLLRFQVRGARFQHVPAVLGAYRLGGVNQRQRLPAMAEVLRSSREHGAPLISAYRGFLWKCTKHCAKLVLPVAIRHLVTSKWRDRTGVTAADSDQLGIRSFI